MQIENVLKARMLEVLSEGRKVAVIGWRSSNHNRTTRRFADSGKILFLPHNKRDLGQSIGYVIFTRFVGHSDQERMQRKTNGHTRVIKVGVIKRVLEACKGVLGDDSVKSFASDVATYDATLLDHFEVTNRSLHVPTEKSSPVIHSEISIERNEMNFKKLAELFVEKADRNGCVGKMKLGRIGKECGIKNTAYLVRNGYVVPKISEGRKHAGQYSATEKLLGQINGQTSLEAELPVNSRDLLAEARVLIAQEPELRAQFNEIHRKLQKLDEAKGLIEKLQALFNS